MSQQTNGLRDQLNQEIAQAERAKSGASESRRNELDITISSARRQVEALDAFEAGHKVWPEEEGNNS